jgi:hypothetical protein
VQGEGCGEVLAKAYCKKKKLCEKHLKVSSHVSLIFCTPNR